MLLTVAVVAEVAHAFIYDPPWTAASVLGAIISTPDAIAATAVCKSLQVLRRTATILEGESLVMMSSPRGPTG